MSKAGDWEFNVWRGGYPAWCEIFYNGKKLAQIRHTELHDIKYAAERAINEARLALPDSHKHEMD